MCIFVHPCAFVCIRLQGVSDFKLTLANVERISEEDSFIGLRCCRDITVLGPVALDGDPLRYSQCKITDSDGASWLEIPVMPGYCTSPESGYVMSSFPTRVCGNYSCMAVDRILGSNKMRWIGFMAIESLWYACQVCM